MENTNRSMNLFRLEHPSLIMETGVAMVQLLEMESLMLWLSIITACAEILIYKNIFL